MRNRFFWMCLVVAITISLAPAMAASPSRIHTVKPEGITIFDLHLPHGALVTVAIHQSKVAAGYPYIPTLLWGGDNGAPSPTVLVALDVTYAGAQIYVPLSAYADLGDVRQAELKATGSGFVLLLDGGDTATNYTADLTFRSECIVSKVVKLMEFPSQDWERIYYSSVSQVDSTKSCGAQEKVSQ